jgi:hypothetical protein
MTDYKFNAKDIKHNVNNGYNVLNNILKIYVDRDYLMIDNRALLLNHDHKSISLKRPVSNHNKTILSLATDPTPVKIPDVNYKLSKFTWYNGSEAFLDSRGLLHLRSADRTLPEVTILLILNRQIACWASDGATCGPEYFTGKQHNKMHASTFYKRYIQSFIDALK